MIALLLASIALGSSLGLLLAVVGLARRIDAINRKPSNQRLIVLLPDSESDSDLPYTLEDSDHTQVRH